MRAKSLASMAVAMLVSATAAHAQIVGTFNGAGSLLANGTAGIGQPVNLNFTTPIIAVPSLTGIFGSILTGSTGVVQNITVGTGAFNVPNFITIGGYTFSLTNVASGTFSPATCFVAAAVGQNCSPPGTPFNFSNVSNGNGGISTSASFSISGMVTTPASQSFAYDGIFTSQFANMSYQQLEAAIDAGTSVPVSYSLNIVAAASTVPEPATLTLMGSGVLGLLGVVGLRRRRA
jgi:PEP-CTERM motif